MSYTPNSVAPKARDDIQAYNITATSLKKFRTAYAKAKNGEGRATISCYGDSITSGYRATAPQYLNSWPAHIRALVDAKTGVVTGTGFVKPSALTEDAGETRFAYTSGSWGSRGSGIFGLDSYNAAGGMLTIGPIVTDRIRVYYLKYSGAGTATTTMDAVAGASIVGNGATSASFQDFTATQGSHTLVITAPTGSDFVFLGFDAHQNGTTSGVRFNNVGYNGSQAANLAGGISGPQMAFNVLAPDLSVICFGDNDLASSTTPAAFKTNMQALINYAYGVSSSVLLLVPPPPGINDPLNNYLNYVSAYYALADANDCALIDTSKRFVSYTSANAEGLMFDGQHPNNRGYWDMAHMVAAALFQTVAV